MPFLRRGGADIRCARTHLPGGDPRQEVPAVSTGRPCATRRPASAFGSLFVMVRAVVSDADATGSHLSII